VKDFNRWNSIQKRLDFYKPKKCHPKEIWWCFWGLNIGREESSFNKDFKRPVLIVKILSSETCIVVPLTTSRDKNEYRINIGLLNGQMAKVIISQIKVIDTRRLTKRFYLLDDETFKYIRKTTRELF
jgi:mRNA-degrading endonuclease toxin of MazEF toxin-antitoxin module